MHNDPDREIAHFAATLRRGSIVAAAGCGKTEQIARAVAFAGRRRLVLTHTHAGVDTISERLKVHNVSTHKYRLDTIAGWCLRFAAAFPQRSGIAAIAPSSIVEWNAVYGAAAQLIQSGAVSGVIDASYDGLFVDEYQDCTRQQHQIIRLLAEQLPICVFGDPLQAIFDFRGQQPVDWDADVFPEFPKQAELATPWRWKNQGNEELAKWLNEMRSSLHRGDFVDFTDCPPCVKWYEMPVDKRFQQAVVIKQCLAAMGDTGDGNLIVIGDAANVNSRTAFAKNLAKKGFSNIEPVACKDLYRAAEAIDRAEGINRFKAVLDFVSKCMTGTDKALFERAVVSRINGGTQGKAKFGAMFPITDVIIQTGSDHAILSFLQAMQDRAGTHLFRREMFFAMRSALKIKSARTNESLRDAIWEVQNRIRHVGRKLSARSIGSTLLVKGLQFDHSVIVHAANMTRKDWYVALTRATRTVRVVSPAGRFKPPD